MNSILLKAYGNFVLDNHPIQLQNKEDILLFANIRNTGIGNLVWLYPVMKALDRKGLVVVCDHEEMRRILQYNLPSSTVCAFKDIPKRKYSISINNFLTQTKENVKKIIDLRIPCRIGHTGIVGKYSWLFNYRTLTHNFVQEMQSNNFLLRHLEISPAKLFIELPPTKLEEKKFDVLLQVRTSNEPERGYERYEELINLLDCRVGLIGSDRERPFASILAIHTRAVNICGMSLIETANLMRRCIVVGNDGGLVKLAHATGAKVIQIIKGDSPYTQRSWIENSTMIDPSPMDVAKKINELMEKH